MTLSMEIVHRGKPDQTERSYWWEDFTPSLLPSLPFRHLEIWLKFGNLVGGRGNGRRELPYQKARDARKKS